MALLKQLFVIAERRNTKKICSSLQSAGAHYQTVIYAHGTARTDLLSVLGLDSSEKSLILATVEPERVPIVMEMLKTNFDFGKGGGIAFTTPVSAVSSPASLLILTGGNINE